MLQLMKVTRCLYDVASAWPKQGSRWSSLQSHPADSLRTNINGPTFKRAELMQRTLVFLDSCEPLLLAASCKKYHQAHAIFSC